MRKLFGTDGIRGIANIHPMTTDIAMKIGRAVAYMFRNRRGRHPRILIERTPGYHAICWRMRLQQVTTSVVNSQDTWCFWII